MFKNQIMNKFVFLSVLLVIAVLVFLPSVQAQMPSLAILIVIDGWRADYIEYLEEDSTFKKLAEDGAYGVGSVTFVSSTSSAHGSIFTGVYPDRHGITGKRYVDDFDDGLQRFDGLSFVQSPTLLDIASDRGEKTAFVSGKSGIGHRIWTDIRVTYDNYPDSLEEYLPELPPMTLRSDDFVKYYNLHDNWIFAGLKEVITRKGATSIFVNIAGPDVIGHAYGPYADETKESVLNFDRDLADFVQFLKDEDLYDETLLVITADHGMSYVDKPLLINDILIDEGYEMREDFLCAMDGNAAYLWFRHEITQELLSFLENIEGVEQVLTQEDMQELRLLHERSPDVILVAEERYMFQAAPLLVELGYTQGSHGSLRDEDMLVPILFHGPNVPTTTIKESVVVDIVPSILFLRAWSEVFTLDFDGIVLPELYK